MKKTQISVVIPILNEKESIFRLYIILKKVLDRIKKVYEIIIVDDGSNDGSFNILRKLAKKDKIVKIIRFRKNLGKSAALSAGLKLAKGDVIITMDGDLQDDSREIPKFLEKINNYDLVVGWKSPRKDPIPKKIISIIFNKLTSFLTGIKVHDSNCCFKAFRKEVAKKINLYGELHRYVPALVHWEGYTVTEVKIRHNPRLYGKSKYGINRIVKGFLDLLTVKFLMTYGKKPLHLFGGIGLLSLTIGVLTGLYLLYMWFLGVGIGDRPLLILTVLLVILGIQFISLGLLGEMIISNHQKIDSDRYIQEVLYN